MNMFKIYIIELEKIARKIRTYLSIGAVAGLVILVLFGVWYGGEEKLNYMTRSIQTDFYFQGKILNVYLITYMILEMMVLQIPVFVTLVTADLLAGESNAGTYRILLTRPVGRIQLVIAKFFAGITFSSFLLFLLVFISITGGYLIFGSGDLIIFRKAIYVFEAADVPWRFACAVLFGMVSMAVVASLSFMFSNFANNSIGPIIATMVVIVAFTIISNINIDFFKMLNPYLFTTYSSDYHLFFDYEIDKPRIIKSLSVLLAHILVFFGITVLTFRRKDILS